MAAQGLDSAISIVRDEMVYLIKEHAVASDGKLTHKCNCMQFIEGQPYEVAGVMMYYEKPMLLLSGHNMLPLEEASTPILIELLKSTI